MTKKAPYYRRHPLFSTMLLLLATTVVLLVILIARLDLAEYRQQLTRELSRVLQQPVEIGKLNLTYEQGLAIEVHGVGVGDRQDMNLQIPLLTAVLRLGPLLDGNVLLDQVIVTEPRLEIFFDGATLTERQATVPSRAGELIDTFGVSLLTVRRGQLFLHYPKEAQKELPSRLENLNLVLRGWGTEQTGRLVVSAELPDEAGHFTLESELPPPGELKEWRQLPLDLKIDVRQLSRDLLPAETRQRLPRHLDAKLLVRGPLQQGAKFQLRAQDHADRRPLLSASGLWASQATGERFSEVELRFPDVTLAAELNLDRTASPLQLVGTLTADELALPPLLQNWLPGKLDKLTDGRLENLTVEFSGSLGDQKAGEPFRYRASAALKGGRWALSDERSLEGISLDIGLDDRSLQLSGGQADFLEQTVFFSGTVHNWQKTATLHLEAAGTIDSSILVEMFPEKIPADLQTNGVVPTTISLDGNHELLQGDIALTLDDLEARFQPLLAKPGGQPAALRLQGHWQPGQLQIDQAQLTLDTAEIRAQLQVPLGTPERPVEIKLDEINLTALKSLSPILQKLQSDGLLQLDLSYWNSENFHGTLSLENLGVHLTRLIGDINGAVGPITFNQQGLDFTGLRARLGRSPVILDGQLRNWKNFLLDLRVRGEVVSARDLVFAHPKMLIQDLDGHLLINKGGIVFDPVTLKLENGTDARVQGYVRNFSDPETFLEIDSTGYADILAIIQLFSGPPKGNPQRGARPAKPIRIQARAAKGTLGGLNFQQAEGTISTRRGLFVLSPLSFRHKDGYCLARVEFEQGKLRVSGHLENFDARVLHSETLKSRGLINGRLRGDFYIEGNGTGDRFWASSKGGVHLEVEDGVLRKFRGLAQIFSLLNVSQLLTLQLPDMDKEGMPFSRLTMSTSIDNGVLATSDTKIVSNAMNMSLIGKRDIVADTVDLTVGVKPLRTVDKIITAIPVAGWLLAGEERALLTAHFRVKGPAGDPEVTAIPVSSLSQTVLGLIKRTLGLPGTLITEPEKLFPDPEGTIPPDQEPEQAPPPETGGADSGPQN